VYYVKFEDETIEEAIAGHWETGYDDIESAKKDTNMSNDEGTAYTIVDKSGKVYYQGTVK
jgi:hypothetical protein